MVYSFGQLTTRNEIEELMSKTDNDFKNFLGLNESIDELENKIINCDEQHKYFLIKIRKQIIGIIYVYDYKKKYNKCSLGYGLLPEFRGKNHSVNITNSFCKFLHSIYGITRIQVDIETTNEHCLHFFTKHLEEMAFEYEGIAKNYWGIGKDVKIYSKCYMNNNIRAINRI